MAGRGCELANSLCRGHEHHLPYRGCLSYLRILRDGWRRRARPWRLLSVIVHPVEKRLRQPEYRRWEDGHEGESSSVTNLSKKAVGGVTGQWVKFATL